MRVVTFLFQAANTLTYTVPGDCRVVGASSGAAVCFSQDPILGTADFTAPTATKFRDDFLLFLRFTGGTSGISVMGLNFLLYAGTKIFANSSAAGAAQLFLEDVLPIP